MSQLILRTGEIKMETELTELGIILNRLGAAICIAITSFCIISAAVIKIAIEKVAEAIGKRGK